MGKYRQARNPINTTPFFQRRNRMPSPRRIKILGLLAFVIIISILFYTTSTRQSQGLESPHDDFYAKTVNALENKGGDSAEQKPPAKAGSEAANADEAESIARGWRLQEAAADAKKKANAKAPKPDPPSSVVGVGNSAELQGAVKGVAGRKKFTEAEKQEVIKEGAGKERENEKVIEEEEIMTPEKRAAVTELNLILKKSPIIIFSKSYCPHSRRAKSILLDKYIIDPKPYVVELDQHKIGADLQSLLAERTGRRTVPNVLVNGVSIGGGDDIAELDSQRNLIDKLTELGAKKIFEVKERPVEAPEAEAVAAKQVPEHGLR